MTGPMTDDNHSQAVEAMARAKRKLEEAGRYSGPPEMAPDGWNLVEGLLELLAYPGLSAVLDGSAVVVPREATGSIRDAATSSSNDRYCDSCGSTYADFDRGYAAMLAASPYATPPTPAVEEGGV